MQFLLIHRRLWATGCYGRDVCNRCAVLILVDVFRKHLLQILTVAPRSVSSIARELGLKRGEIEEDLHHMIRTARAAGHRVIVEPARCRTCGFLFADDKLGKPGKCPACRSTWLFEAQVSVLPSDDS
jgi:transcriptional regulator